MGFRSKSSCVSISGGIAEYPMRRYTPLKDPGSDIFHTTTVYERRRDEAIRKTAEGGN